MYSRRRGTRLMSQINVVPYIDVMLVLLVIFMVTAPLINSSVVDLPQVSRATAPPVAPLEVTVKSRDFILLRDRARGGVERQVKLSELAAAVKSRQKETPDQAVVIAADKEVPYGEVIEVMDVLQRGGVRKVGLLAKPRSG